MHIFSACNLEFCLFMAFLRQGFSHSCKTPYRDHDSFGAPHAEPLRSIAFVSRRKRMLRSAGGWWLVSWAWRRPYWTTLHTKQREKSWHVCWRYSQVDSPFSHFLAPGRIWSEIMPVSYMLKKVPPPPEQKPPWCIWYHNIPPLPKIERDFLLWQSEAL